MQLAWRREIGRDARAPRVGALALALALALTGCECGVGSEAPVARAGARTTPPGGAAEDEGEVVPLGELPEADPGRTAASVPMITVEASTRGYFVTNRALIESWPPPERERVRASAPPEAPDFPVIERPIPALDDATLLVTGVRDALSRALEAEHARSGRDATPPAFAIRAPATLSWARVARVIFTAAMVGLSEPALVVRAGGDERVVRLVRPAVSAVSAPAMRSGALGEALRALPGAEGSAPGAMGESPDAVAARGGGDATGDGEAPSDDGHGEAPSAPLSFTLDAHGLRVHRGLVEVGAGCRTPGADASPAIPLVALGDGHTLSDCLAALGEGPAMFRADGEVTHGSATLVLELLAARGPVELTLAAP